MVDDGGEFSLKFLYLLIDKNIINYSFLEIEDEKIGVIILRLKFKVT